MRGEYAEVAKRHMETFLPAMYRTKKNAGKLESYLQQVEEMVREKTQERVQKYLIENPIPAEMGYLERAAHLNWVNRTIKHEVLKEWVYLEPEPGNWSNI